MISIDWVSNWFVAAVGAATLVLMDHIGNMVFRYKALKLLREIRDELKKK